MTNTTLCRPQLVPSLLVALSTLYFIPVIFYQIIVVNNLLYLTYLDLTVETVVPMHCHRINSYVCHVQDAITDGKHFPIVLQRASYWSRRKGGVAEVLYPCCRLTYKCHAELFPVPSCGNTPIRSTFLVPSTLAAYAPLINNTCAHLGTQGSHLKQCAMQCLRSCWTLHLYVYQISAHQHVSVSRCSIWQAKQ